MPIVWPFSGSPAPKVLCCEVKGKREALYMRKELPVGRRSTVARDNYLFHRTRNQLIIVHAACVKNPGLRNNDTYSYVSRPPIRTLLVYLSLISCFSTRHPLRKKWDAARISPIRDPDIEPKGVRETLSHPAINIRSKGHAFDTPWLEFILMQWLRLEFAIWYTEF